MPTASDELRAKIDSYFGSGVDCWVPLKFLLDQGWLDNRGLLIPPKREITPKEWDCVAFLVEEWDFGYASEPARSKL